MATYRTPDVYVEEISVFPPSVAEVETAIPAFIGYTAKAERMDGSGLSGVPTRVSSLLEYESLFGTGPKLDLDRVELDDNDNFLRAVLGSDNTKYLYDSLRLFFDNGGGKCYIVSVGKDTDATDKDQLIEGLRRIATLDEPTILLFPDAAGLGSAELAEVQITAINQCGKLRDRVTLLDTAQYSDKPGHAAAIGDFRGKVGINQLKYAAAYAPWLKVSYSKNIGFADISRPQSKLFKGASKLELSNLTSDETLLKRVASLNSVHTDIADLATRTSSLSSPASSVSARQNALLAAYRGDKSAANMQSVFAFLTEIARSINAMVRGAPLANADLQDATKGYIAGPLKTAYSKMIALERELAAAVGAGYTEQWNGGQNPDADEWGGIFDASAPSASTGVIPSTGEEADKLDAALPAVHATFAQASSVWSQIVASASSLAAMHEQFLQDNFAPYRSILRGINATITGCPPSGAIAGVYALVDNQRGVWKSPANVSLTGVTEPAYYLDADDTDDLNIDPVAGKSINAIRYFVGKGTLVFGARTLAGNDNEWRYVSVRRFFNMVEESVKESTHWAVFEPNDANTWVKVRGMIENYLTQKWREGALAGATTKDAFFVRCGLGVTMNAQDILEGRMNVEIGMAVVRPAEFIVLKFSHKLQTS